MEKKILSFKNESGRIKHVWIKQGWLYLFLLPQDGVVEQVEVGGAELTAQSEALPQSARVHLVRRQDRDLWRWKRCKTQNALKWISRFSFRYDREWVINNTHFRMHSAYFIFVLVGCTVGGGSIKFWFHTQVSRLPSDQHPMQKISVLCLTSNFVGHFFRPSPSNNANRNRLTRKFCGSVSEQQCSGPESGTLAFGWAPFTQNLNIKSTATLCYQHTLSHKWGHLPSNRATLCQQTLNICSSSMPWRVFRWTNSTLRCISVNWRRCRIVRFPWEQCEVAKQLQIRKAKRYS